MPLLDREEYIEQAYFFATLAERLAHNQTTQEMLASLQQEVLATTNLPKAIDFLASELRHSGVFSSAMAKLPHYFTPFQTFVVAEAEKERGRFDLQVALHILRHEAKYRADGAAPQGTFLYQFECISRNRLGYARGFEAMAQDPLYDDHWKSWIRTVQRQIGLVDFADLLYVRSDHYITNRLRQGLPLERDEPSLFGEKEGKIALANRRKDPMFMFAALQRQLGYPAVPRPQPPDETPQLLYQLTKKMERMEFRLKLLEEEQKGGLDITKFYGPPPED